MSSPAPGTATQDADEPRGFTGAEWDAATDAGKIRLLLGTEPKGRPRRWGWAVYRTAYGTEFDGAWAALRDRIARQMGDSLSFDADADSAAAAAAAMDWIFVEDAATLEGAGRDALRRCFADWAAAEAPDVDLATETGGRGARYEYFLQADTETLTSVLRLADAAPAATPYVNLVRAWPETLPEDIALDEDGNPYPAEDWMKMALDAVYPSNYIAMDHPETWSVFYRDPDEGAWV